MRNLALSIAAIVVAAFAVFAWSRTALVSPQASPAASITVGVAAARAAATISPMEMMMDDNRPLPVEQWDPT